ncbi:hypothetical protein MTR_4g033190 [Medicago truncatula]|uniref:Uncharacterized protein n=1 Tax=Medicago truncatula TaxID=3880 RepID=A0A072UHR8_MEDTR|nr:hypothetical protein MTR_4g033190 [Medicago truncatula]
MKTKKPPCYECIQKGLYSHFVPKAEKAKVLNKSESETLQSKVLIKSKPKTLELKFQKSSKPKVRKDSRPKTCMLHRETKAQIMVSKQWLLETHDKIKAFVPNTDHERGRLRHANFRLISKFIKQKLVKGLPELHYHSDALCGACQKGKNVKATFKPKNIVSTSRPLELLHIDLFGLVSIASINGKIELGSKTPEQVESNAGTYDSEDASESDQPSDTEKKSEDESSPEAESNPEAESSSEAEPNPEAQNENAYEDIQDNTQHVIQSKFKHKSSHPEEIIIESKESPRRTRSQLRQEESLIGMLSIIEPKTVEEALSDDGWILAMQEELNQFQRNDVWDLICLPLNKKFGSEVYSEALVHQKLLTEVLRKMCF